MLVIVGNFLIKIFAKFKAVVVYTAAFTFQKNKLNLSYKFSTVKNDVINK